MPLSIWLSLPVMLFRLVLLGFLSVGCGNRSFAEDGKASPPPAAGVGAVEIDFGKALGPVTGRASGILLSLSKTEPPDEMVAPLKPQLFRGSHQGQVHHTGQGVLDLYPRLRSLGVRHVQYLLSDDSTYGWMGGWPGDGGDWSAWEKTVAADVAEVQAAGAKVEYDIWNEPDSTGFWKRSQAQYLETWKRTVLLVRRLDPGAEIVGPSESDFHEAWMKEFLLFAKANNVLPDIVSWHELTCDLPYGQIGAHVDFVKKTLRENAIPIERISINETVGENVHDIPGIIVGYMAALEKAGVESAARSCWEERPGIFNGANNSLDGLLTDPEKQPRGAWWVYKAYADLAGTLVETRTDTAVNALASFDRATKSAHLLLGRFHGDGSPLHVVLRGVGQLGLASGQALHISGRRIPETGWKPLPQPESILEGTLTPQGDTLEFHLDGVGKYDACVVDITPAP